MSEQLRSRDDLVITQRTVDKPVPPGRRFALGALLVLLGATSVTMLGLLVNGDAITSLTVGDASKGAWALAVPARWLGVVLGVVVLTLGVYQIARGFRPPRIPLVLGLGFLLFMLAFLAWVSTKGEGVDVVGLLSNSVSLAIPLILGALAGVMCERSGVINVAIEGQMLAGAFGGALFGSLMNNYVGLLAAAVFGAVIGWMLAVFAIKYLVNQVVLGVVINVFALGLTGFFYNAYMQQNTQQLNSPGQLPVWNVPGLSAIPVVGPLLFQANVLVYLTYVLVVVVDVWLFRTRWGLRTRAIGEHPKAADTVGINVNAMRYRNVMLGGAIAGLGGAFFTIGSVGGFSYNITSGNGFIALAALIFGRWNPRGAVAAALLFGFFSALQTMLSINASGIIPSSFLQMLPYLATVLAVAGLVGRVQAPAADGEPYTKA